MNKIVAKKNDNAEPVREQLAGLAMGSIQQFIYADRLTQLMVPLVPLEQRRLWEQVVPSRGRSSLANRLTEPYWKWMDETI